MKYSIGGSIFASDGTGIVNIINNYKLWRLTVANEKDSVTNLNTFTFEAWVDSELDKNSLFTDLKNIVDTNNGFVNWHACTHDENNAKPCIIVEEYRGLG